MSRPGRPKGEVPRPQAEARPANATVPAGLYGLAGLAGGAIGLFGTLVAALLAAAGWPEAAVGSNGSVFFLFVMLAGPLGGLMMRRAGVRAALAAGLALTAASALAFALAHGATPWTVLRAAMGLGVGLYMVGGQAALGLLAAPGRRGAASGMQALAFGVGMGLGPLLGAALYPLSPLLAFGAGALLLVLAQGLVLRLPAMRLPPAGPGTVPASWRRVTLPLHAVLAYGAAEATLMTLFPVFMLGRGHGMAAMGAAFAAFVAGSLASVVPVTRAADRHGVPAVMAACAALGVAACVGIDGLPPQAPPWLLGGLAALAGAAVGPLFPLALAALGALLPPERLSHGTAWFTTAFSVGSLGAPWLAGLAMQHWGAAHLFTLTALLLAALLLRLVAALWRQRAGHGGTSRPLGTA